MKNPVLAIDIDDTLMPLADPLIEYSARAYGTNSDKSAIREYNLSNFWNCSDGECLRRIYEYYYLPEFAQIKPFRGTKAGLKKLKQNFDLIVITSRPNIIEDKTISWINTHFPNIFRDVIHTNQFSDSQNYSTKAQICKDHKAFGIIEDHFDHALDCAKQGIYAWLFKKPWNQNAPNHPKITKIKTWREAIQVLAP
jgi:uncharacterized HAD superfamily protein